MMCYSLLLVGLFLASVSAQTVATTRTPYVVAVSNSSDPEYSIHHGINIEDVNQKKSWMNFVPGVLIDGQPVTMIVHVFENQAHFLTYKFKLFHAQRKNFDFTVRGELILGNHRVNSTDIVRTVNEKLTPSSNSSKEYPLLDMATILNRANGWLSGSGFLSIKHTVKKYSEV